MPGVLADCRHAIRLYRRTPLASLIAVVVLAVGMAFVGAFLSLYVDLVFKPHAGIEDSGRIVTIGQLDAERFTGLPVGLIERISEEVSALELAVGIQSQTLALGPEAERQSFELVTLGFFDGLRPRLAMGRGFDRADHEPDAAPVVVISDRYWREELDAAPDILGTTLEVVQQAPRTITVTNGRAELQEPDADQDTVTEVQIVGVMAPQMRGIMNDRIAVWAPFERFVSLTSMGSANLSLLRSQLTLRALGRLSPGATATALARELQTRYPESTDEYRLQDGMELDAVKGVVRDINVHRDSGRQLRLFLAGSVLLALVAAANVSLFLLARAPGRRRELAIRVSVGAPIRRLARQLASESGLLVVVAALLGLFTSVLLVNFLRGLAFLRQAEWSNVTLFDWRVLSTVGVFLLLLTLLVSLAPILGLKRLGIAASSRQVAARATLAQRVAGTVQIAIAGTLGGAAIAFAGYLGSMVLGYPGYETEDRHYVQFSPVFLSQLAGVSGPIRINGMNLSSIDAARQREAIESVPGIDGITFTTAIPGQLASGTRGVRHPDDPTQQIAVGTASIDEAFVEVLNLRLLYGRAPGENEIGTALVNQTLAQRFFGRDDVVGEFLDVPNDAGPTTEIIGVLADLSFEHPAADVEPILFTRIPLSPFGIGGVISSRLPTAEVQQALLGLIESGELEFGAAYVGPLGDLRRNLIAPDTARSWLTIGTASLVVLLAAFGFYGTQRYLVTAGRREYAIRASLGAGPAALGRLVFRRGLMLSLPGLVLGALLAFIAVAWLRDDFVSRDTSPGLVTLGVVAGMTVLLLVASLGPARQARRTQPAPLLRED